MTQRTFPELFEAVVAKHPDATAVITEHRTVSYQELDHAANRLAHTLIGRCAGPEAPVVVTVPRSLGWLEAVLAVLKAGACYVPVDLTHPPTRLAALLEGIRPVLTLTTREAADRFPGQVMVIDERGLPSSVKGSSSAPLDTDRLSPLLPQHPAYVIHTSGSTGTPKGVQVTHSGFAALLSMCAERQGVVPGSRILQGVSPYFDVSMGDLVMGLLTGATLVLPPCADPPTGAELAALMNKHAVTHLLSTPGVLGTLEPEDVTRRTTLTGGGEVFPEDMLSRWSRRHRVLMAYGPSETTVLVTLSAEAEGAPRPTMGRPGDAVVIRVLDDRLRPVPAGNPGELYVGGPSLARGYLGRPALTAERFIADPCGPVGERLYRTGDVVKLLPDGNLGFIARADTQVKIRGYRIEPAEVEAALLAHPGVGQAAVRTHPAPGGVMQLTAYVVPPPGRQSPLGTELKEFLGSVLPGYMVPAFVVPLAVMPLNANGKTDRAALPAPVAASRRVLAAPRDEIEERLCAIWCETLEVAQVGINDDFFELGGHSLLAARIVARATGALGVDLPVRALFDNPTVRRFAASCRTSAAVDATRVPRHAGGAAQLSFAQRRLWFLDQMVTDPSVYNIQSLWQLTGPLDADALRQSLNDVWQRHDVLRARFENDEGKPRLAFSSASSFPLHKIDLSAWPPSEAEQRAREAARLDADLKFDLEDGPLVRAQLMTVGDQRHFLLLSFHHIVIDGWSGNVLWREVSELYGARVAGSPTSLAPLAVQYHDYAAWQREWLAGPDAAEQLAFWQEQLRGSTTLELPTDHPRPKMLSGRGGQVDFTVPQSTYQALARLGRDNRASLFMVLLTAFDVLLSRYTASRDIITGSPISGRVRPELDDLIGFFVNTIPLRLRWSGDPDFTELLAVTREVALNAYAREGVPFDTIVTRLAADRDPSRNPIFQIWFDVDSTPEPEQLSGLRSELVESKMRNARFDLEMLLTERNGDLSGRLVHSTDLFTTETAGRLVEHFLRLLKAVAAAPNRSISGLAMLGTHEREALVALGRGDAQGVPSIDDPTVALAHQVARTPDRVALSGKTSLTYAELDARANQVAHKLREEGIGPEDVVGVCMERDTDVFLVMLAVMKAGAVYMPLDPVHPTSRLAHMARSAEASVVLCDTSLRQDFPPGQYRVRDTNAFLAEARTSRYPITSPRRGVSPGNVSYAVFTSGSTGQPKGIALGNATIGNLVAWKLAEGHGPRVCAQLSSIGFDVSLQEFFETLCSGGTLVIVDDEQRADLDRLIDVLGQERVECVYCSPTMLQQLASTWTERTDKPQLALREITVGGEPLRITLELRELLGSLGGATVENQYGPSETHKATRLLLTGDEGDWPVAPSIGTPIANVSVYLLDPSLCPVPPGVRGEVYIASPGTARGYLGRPTLTSERFVADPFATSAGSRMYRTGDVARWDATGQLEFAGRNDDQVKIRGYRVEPAEVATAITAHPRVLDSTVFAQIGPDGLPYLAAYTVHAVDTAPVTTRDLRDFLSDHLPDYMIPAAFVPVPELPLNRNGKVDRARLPDPLGAGVMASEKRVLPRNPQERLIAGIWSEVLSIGELGIDDNFFELGGHSLLATRVMSRVRKTFALAISVRALFENPTIRRLAQAVEEAIVTEVTASSKEESAAHWTPPAC